MRMATLKNNIQKGLSRKIEYNKEESEPEKQNC